MTGHHQITRDASLIAQDHSQDGHALETSQLLVTPFVGMVLLLDLRLVMINLTME